MGTGIVAHLSRDDLKLDKENDKDRRDSQRLMMNSDLWLFLLIAV